MTSFVLTGILFVLNFVSFPCEGKIILPSDGARLVVAPGEDAKIEWTFDDDTGALITRQWFNQAGEILAQILLDGDVLIANTSLPGVDVTKPATLIFKNVDLRHNQTYKFVLAVSLKNPQSSYVTIFVAVKPNATIDCSTPTTVNKSDDVKCLCKGQGGNPPANVTWYKNGVKFGATKIEENLLSLINVTGTDSGTYKCVAQSYKTFKDEKTINVTVNLKPNVVIECSTPTTVKKSNEVKCLCKGQGGNPTASVTWYKNGVQFGATKKEENLLSLINVTGTDSGTYKCVAQSYKTFKDEKSIKVTVNFAPAVTSITSFPTKTVLGKSVTISCEANARPSPSYTIIHNGTDTVSNEKTYTICVVNGSHSGSYQCIAKNFLGNSSKTINLIVIFKGSFQTTANACICNKVESGSSVVAWHVMVSLLSGIVIGIVLSYIVVYFRRRFRKMKPAQSKPEQQTGSKVDSIYQDLDLSKMNQDENYETLGAVNSGDAESDYTELNLVKDVEDNCQSST